MSGHFSSATKTHLTRLSLLCTVLLILPASPVASLRAQSSQEQRAGAGAGAGAVTLSDYYRFESVGAPAISPDVAYVRTLMGES